MAHRILTSLGKILVISGVLSFIIIIIIIIFTVIIIHFIHFIVKLNANLTLSDLHIIFLHCYLKMPIMTLISKFYAKIINNKWLGGGGGGNQELEY